jgi:hypothetical protein
MKRFLSSLVAECNAEQALGADSPAAARSLNAHERNRGSESAASACYAARERPLFEVAWASRSSAALGFFQAIGGVKANENYCF